MLRRLLTDRVEVVQRLADRWAVIHEHMDAEYHDVLRLLHIEDQLVFIAKRRAGGQG